MNRLLKSLWWCGLCGLLSLGVSVKAQVPLYQNLGISQYYIPTQPNQQPPPTIDATAFDNEALFEVTFGSYAADPELYETEDTLFFTNNGTMIANAPIPTNVFTGFSAGAGFNFDYYQQSTYNELMASSFYNAGSIYCDSTNYGNNLLDVFITFNGNFAEFIQTSIGECTVSATNIYNPGLLDVGYSGLMKFTGQAADFSRGQLTMETGPSGLGTVNGYGTFGTDTNGDWDPGTDLGVNYAFSSYSGGYFLDLTNSVPYFNEVAQSTNAVVWRAVFLQDTSFNVQTNVYIDPTVNTVLLNFAAGASHVEWVGTYVDPASGMTLSNFLYLTDDYALGASTNVLFSANGIPDNFTFDESTTRLNLGAPTPASTFVVPNYPNLTISNPYSYFNASLIASEVDTNANIYNPHGVLTNLPGRLEITATKDLNLNLSSIQGPNYMQLIATNQYDGSSGSQIDVPYSDIALGVTNGFLTISNLLASDLPQWSGTVQGWSTRFFSYDTVNQLTNDYRVLLVASQLNPVSNPQIDNLWLHSSNSVVISDDMSVFGSLYIDGKNLTLTTNGPGAGASALDGELNWENTATIGQAQLPNLLWVTNNGAIRSLGLVNFGSASDVYGAFINNGLVADQGTTFYVTNFVSDGAVSNGMGSFLLTSKTTTLTNGSIYAGQNVSINTGTLLTSNLWLTAGRALNLTATNQLTDSGATNGNFWSVGTQASSASPGLYLLNGFNVPLLPPPNNQVANDLRYTTVTNTAPANARINNLWAGLDQGYSVSGYTNNVAVGHLILDASNSSSLFYFNGTGTHGTNNAIYVDELELRDWAASHPSGYAEFPQLLFNTNIVIYYAQAIINGVSVATLINGANGNHLRWMPAYAGVFSSTNKVYPPGVTNMLNAALVGDANLDSNGNGNPNNTDPDAIFVPAQVGLTSALTNVPPKKARLVFYSIPAATNTVYWTTNLLAPNWQVLSNFISPTNVPPVNGWPITNVIYDTTSPVNQKFYRVLVNPNTLDEYGY